MEEARDWKDALDEIAVKAPAPFPVALSIADSTDMCMTLCVGAHIGMHIMLEDGENTDDFNTDEGLNLTVKEARKGVIGIVKLIRNEMEAAPFEIVMTPEGCRDMQNLLRRLEARLRKRRKAITKETLAQSRTIPKPVYGKREPGEVH